VTNNLTDFPTPALQTWDIEAKSPDDFVLDQLDLSRDTVYGAVQRIADSWRQPPEPSQTSSPRWNATGWSSPQPPCGPNVLISGRPIVAATDPDHVHVSAGHRLAISPPILRPNIPRPGKREGPPTGVSAGQRPF